MSNKSKKPTNSSSNTTPNNAPGTFRVIPNPPSSSPSNNSNIINPEYIQKLLEIYKERNNKYKEFISFLLNKQNCEIRIKGENIYQLIEKLQFNLRTGKYNIVDTNSYQDFDNLIKQYQTIESELRPAYKLLLQPECNIQLKPTEKTYLDNVISYLEQDPKLLVETILPPRYPGPGEPPRYMEPSPPYTEKAPPAASAPTRAEVRRAIHRRRLKGKENLNSGNENLNSFKYSPDKLNNFSLEKLSPNNIGKIFGAPPPPPVNNNNNNPANWGAPPPPPPPPVNTQYFGGSYKKNKKKLKSRKVTKKLKSRKVTKKN